MIYFCLLITITQYIQSENNISQIPLPPPPPPPMSNGHFSRKKSNCESSLSGLGVRNEKRFSNISTFINRLHMKMPNINGCQSNQFGTMGLLSANSSMINVQFLQGMYLLERELSAFQDTQLVCMPPLLEAKLNLDVLQKVLQQYRSSLI